MDALSFICASVACAAVVSMVLSIVLSRRRIRKTLAVMNRMLDAAIDGSFSERLFDESVLSSTEGRLSRYLSLCAVSSKNLLTEKEKIKQLISDISHQTKTPIANILLYAQLLGEYDLPEDGAVCTRALSAQAEKLNFLISALVKTSRLETGIITVLPKEELVQHLLDEVQKQISPKAQAKGIAVTVDPTLINACYDLKWTTEAVYNIADNAVKYTDCGGSLHIKATAYELFCRIDLCDSGIGIAEEEHSKIFARFYRSASVSNQDGVGIGLFLTREIISAQGGYIQVSSRPGNGSTFSVFLPMES